MNFDEYQDLSMRTAGGFDNQRELLDLAALGLAGESGEVVDLIKKRFYHPHRDISDEDIIEEAGDVLWYLAVLASAINVPFSELAEKNVRKLEARYPNGFPEQTNTLNNQGDQ